MASRARVAPDAGGGRQVLVVEDDDITARTLALLLRSWGHHVDVLRPNGTVADLWDLFLTDSAKYDAFVLKTVSGGPGQSLLDAAGNLRAGSAGAFRVVA